MSLEFISPRAAGAPAARSPLADSAVASGGITEVRHGWEVAVSFGDPAAEAAACEASVGFADLSHLEKLELQARPDLLETAFGVFVPGRARQGEQGLVCPLAPGLRLLLRVPESEEGGRHRPPAGIRCCDLTGSFAAMAIVGPAARDVFARFCALDLRETAMPVGGFRPGSVARTPGHVLREGPDRYLVLFGAAYGEYLWQVVADAAERLGGRPVGLDALPVPSEVPHA